MEPAPTRIYAMLNISQVGNFGNELYLSPTFQPINVKAAINTINNNKDKIVAIKVRINGDHNELMHDLEVLKRACMGGTKPACQSCCTGRPIGSC